MQPIEIKDGAKSLLLDRNADGTIELSIVDNRDTPLTLTVRVKPEDAMTIEKILHHLTWLSFFTKN